MNNKENDSNRKNKVIMSVNDFMDERSRKIANQNGFGLGDIIYKFGKIIEEEALYGVGNEPILIKIGHRSTAINILENYRQGFASGAIINYELTKRNPLKIFLGAKIISNIRTRGIDSPLTFTIPLVSIINGLTTDFHEIRGKCYEDHIEMVEKCQRGYIDRILDE